MLQQYFFYLLAGLAVWTIMEIWKKKRPNRIQQIARRIDDLHESIKRQRSIADEIRQEIEEL